MKLNLGCGYNRLNGYLNVDREAMCSPDQVVDLEQFPWPWADNTFSEVMAYHTLEHLGQTPEKWLGFWKELYRVCLPNAVINIAVPHPRHDNFVHDPTHVRAITPITIAMLDQARNMQELESGGQETKLGFYIGVDFELKQVFYDLVEPWNSRLRAGLIGNEEMNQELQSKNNVCYQIRMVVQATKPVRFTPQEILARSRVTNIPYHPGFGPDL